MIKVQGLQKHYGDVYAVKGINFHVLPNSFFALLGQNGAGKSTTIEILSTLLSYDEGEVEINGFKLGKDDWAIRESIGVVFQYSTLDKKRTGLENLKTKAAFYKMDSKTFEKRYNILKEVIGFESYINQNVMTLSGGQVRKLDIAKALLHEPKILILDEPTTGLDPKARKDIWALVKTIKEAKDMTIFLTTHYMEEVLDADHVVILHQGKIVAEDSAENLRTRFASDYLKVPFNQKLIKKLIDKNLSHKIVNNRIHISLKNPFEGIDLIKIFKDDISTFEIIKASMDDVFINLTGETIDEVRK